ncbi:tyrosine-type recombinase/integrase [Gimesia algae]|uniref:Phage integrase family protein n=1 Tax=Gimesia algae TaxID=2527971 RepID=A0A517VMR4_9PLAN|nr:tyrosine-type recombinase/integrase [Gimesia algae]QDT94307.1 Phage integrase family protein [Gimesia algae]
MQQRRVLTDDSGIHWAVYVLQYIQSLSVHGKNAVYISNVKRVLDRFTLYCNLINLRLNEITDQHLEAYLAKRKDDRPRGKPLSNISLNNEIGFLNTCLGKAGPKEARGPGRRNYGHIEFPPYCELLTVDETDPQVVTVEQIQQFSEASQNARSPMIDGCTPAEFWRAALVLGLVTGLRRRGLLLIQRPEDRELLGKRELFLPAKYHKTRNSLRIPLGSMAVVDILAKLPSKEGEPLLPWINGKTGKPLSFEHFSNTMTRMQREAGIPEDQRVKSKHLRSTAATIIAEGISDEVATKRLGHAPGSKTMLTHYRAKRVSDTDRQASELLGQMVLPHVSGPQIRIFNEGA